MARTQFDEYDQPDGPKSWDRLDIHAENVDLNRLADVTDVLLLYPIDARVAVPDAHTEATTLWFIDPDNRQRQALLLPAPDVGPWRTRWFSPDCPLQRDFWLHIPARGRIEAHWDLGIFAGNDEPSDWKKLDSDFDDWLTAQLRDLGFADP